MLPVLPTRTRLKVQDCRALCLRVLVWDPLWQAFLLVRGPFWSAVTPLGGPPWPLSGSPRAHRRGDSGIRMRPGAQRFAFHAPVRRLGCVGARLGSVRGTLWPDLLPVGGVVDRPPRHTRGVAPCFRPIAEGSDSSLASGAVSGRVLRRSPEQTKTPGQKPALCLHRAGCTFCRWHPTFMLHGLWVILIPYPNAT